CTTRCRLSSWPASGPAPTSRRPTRSRVRSPPRPSAAPGPATGPACPPVVGRPAFNRAPGWLRSALDGWGVAAIVTATSGRPYGFSTRAFPGWGAGPSGTGNSLGGATVDRPDVTPSQPCRAHRGDREQWFNPDVVTWEGVPLGAGGAGGDSGRALCDGPGFFQADLPPHKKVPLGRSVQLRVP